MTVNIYNDIFILFIYMYIIYIYIYICSFRALARHTFRHTFTLRSRESGAGARASVEWNHTTSDGDGAR